MDGHSKHSFQRKVFFKAFARIILCEHIQMLVFIKSTYNRGFPGGAVVESLPANSGDTGSSPGLGRSHMLRSN